MTDAAASTEGRSPALVSLDRVTCTYGKRHVLLEVTLRLDRQSFIAIVGPSGSGKTTLLRALVGSIAPTVGTVVRADGLTIGYVPQVETVNWHFPVTVAEVLLMARRGRLLPWASRQERHEIARLLDRLGIGGLERRHILELSGGQQQRVFIARALLHRPQLLLLDEPTSGVDLKTRHDFLHLLHDLHRDGIAIALTTHDLNGVATHVPELLCLNERVIARGAPFEVLRPDVLERTYGAPMDVLEHGGLLLVVDRHPEAPRRDERLRVGGLRR